MLYLFVFALASWIVYRFLWKDDTRASLWLMVADYATRRAGRYVRPGFEAWQREQQRAQSPAESETPPARPRHPMTFLP